MKLKQLLSTIVYSVLVHTIKCRRPRNTVDDNSITVLFMAALGDFLVFCSAAKALHECGYKIRLICHEGTGIEESASISGLFEKIIPISKRYSARIKNIRMLRKMETQVAFAAPLGRHILPDIYLMALRANKRIVPDTMLDCDSKYLKQKIDCRVDQVIKLTATHERARYECFLRETGFVRNGLSTFKFFCEADTPPRKYIEVFPGAGGGKEKCWPPKHYAQVVLKLLESQDSEVLILGTQNDVEYANELQSHLGNNVSVQNLCGATTMVQLCTLLRSARIVLSNDSGAAHMSIACDAPTVVVAGGWQYGRFYPDADLKAYHQAVMVSPEQLSCISCNKSRPNCMNGTNAAPCVLQISVDEVFETAVHCMENYELSNGVAI